MVESSGSRTFSVWYLNSFRRSPSGETTPAAIFVPPTSTPTAFIASSSRVSKIHPSRLQRTVSSGDDRLLYSSCLKDQALTSATNVGGEYAVPRSGGRHHGWRLGARAGAGTQFRGGGSRRRRGGRGRRPRNGGSRRDLRGRRQVPSADSGRNRRERCRGYGGDN